MQEMRDVNLVFYKKNSLELIIKGESLLFWVVIPLFFVDRLSINLDIHIS